MFSGSTGFVGLRSGFTEGMFDEVTVCEVADSGGTAFEGGDGFEMENGAAWKESKFLEIVRDGWNIFDLQRATSFIFWGFKSASNGLGSSYACWNWFEQSLHRIAE